MSNKKKKRNKSGKVVIVKKSAPSAAVNAVKPLPQSDDLQTVSDREPVVVADQAEIADQAGAVVADPETDEEITAYVKPKRIWEVDFVRGLMILFVVWDHFMWDIADIGSSVYNTKLFSWLYELTVKYYGGSLRAVTHDVFVTMFVFTSGVSCSFSRSNGKRALKMCIFALLFSIITYAASAAVRFDITIYFNVIHVIALSVAIYAGIEWIWSKLRTNWQKNIFGVLYFAVTMTALVVGHCAKYMNVNWMDLVFGESSWRTAILAKMEHGGDYLSFLPDFGWFLTGAFLGKIVYRKRESVFPSVDPRYVSPVTFCGRYSIWIYFGSQIVMFGFIYLLHELWPVL